MTVFAESVWLVGLPALGTLDRARGQDSPVGGRNAHRHRILVCIFRGDVGKHLTGHCSIWGVYSSKKEEFETLLQVPSSFGFRCKSRMMVPGCNLPMVNEMWSKMQGIDSPASEFGPI